MPPWEPPSPVTQFLASPLIFLLRPVYSLLSAIRSPPRTHSTSQFPIQVACISDTHTRKLSSVPDGDILLHAGDLTNAGTVEEIQEAIDWLKTLPHKYKVVIAGNHDGWLDEQTRMAVLQSVGETGDDNELGQQTLDVLDWGDIIYLQNSSVKLAFTPEVSAAAGTFSPSSSSSSRIVTIHGVPQIPQLEPSPPGHVSIHAFQYPPSLTNADSPYPSPIPRDADILISHSPPLHHRDMFPNSIGCPHLLDVTWRVKPALHVFGHVHGGRGVDRVYYDDAQLAWERLCGRRMEGGELWERGNRSWFFWLFVRAGILRDMLSIGWAWRDVVTVLWGSAKAILWTRVWGGERPLGREGWMVNAACMDPWGSGKLVGKGVVIEI